MPILEASNIIKLYKQYDVTVTAVNRVNLKVEDGGILLLLWEPPAPVRALCFMSAPDLIKQIPVL